MLLYVMEKMVDFNEKGYKISPEQPDQSSLVNNFAAQIQAILRFNFQSEQNNSSNTMKKIYEIFYLFFKISYKTDKELFTSQFNMFLDPMYNLLQTKSRDDSISRLKVLSKIIYELSESKSTRNDVLELLARKGNSHKQMLLIFEGFIQDTSSIILSSNSQSNQSEVLTIKIINDKLDMSLYLDTIKHVIESYCSVHM